MLIASGTRALRPRVFSMEAFPVRFKSIATVLLTITLVVIGALNLRARAAWSDPWDGVVWEGAPRGLRAAEVSEDGPGAAGGIAVGDLLVAINGTPVPDLGRYFGEIDRLGVAAQTTYAVADAAGAERTVSVQIGSRALLGPRD